MGNGMAVSSSDAPQQQQQQQQDDPFWNPASSQPTTQHQESVVATASSTSSGERISEFKQEIDRRHERRRQLIAERRQELNELREQLQYYKTRCDVLEKTQQPISTNSCSHVDEILHLIDENAHIKCELDALRSELRDGEAIVAKNKELRVAIAEMQSELQGVNTELSVIEQERLEYGKQISALKDVVRVTKNMLEIREDQIENLKVKVKSIEDLLASSEMKIMSDGLREEYEKQLRNIRNLKTLYEERQRLDKKDKEHLQTQLDDAKKLVEDERKKNEELVERIAELETDNSRKYDAIHNVESALGLSRAECKELQAEINVVNQLFSEILLGFNSTQEVDLDRLIKILEENHDLLTNIVTNEESNATAAALPKLLLDLINQSNKKKNEDRDDDDDDNDDESSDATQHVAVVQQDMVNPPSSSSSSGGHQLNSAEEIVENLPKVWRVLIELLSHQNPPSNVLSPEAGDPCYKSIETPTGPKLKLSVSQTFIRLKDLILEKKFLERETYRLKHLNTHLEGRLQDQEKRLELVSGEVKKTWHVVGKMQRQHQQLHTHEKVLRYELQQKRILLTKLKEELDEAREKWTMARAKQDTTQEQWKELRREFAARKATTNDDFNHSAESGYSDDKDSTSEEEEEIEKDCCYANAVDSNATTHTGVSESKQNNLEVVAIDDSTPSQENSPLEDDKPASTTSIDNKDGDKTDNIEIDCDSTTTTTTSPCKSPDELLSAREERLKRLEEQCRQLVAKVTNTTQKSVAISNKLDSLHEIYGESSSQSVDNTAASTELNNSSSDAVAENQLDKPDEGDITAKVTNTPLESIVISNNLDSFHETNDESLLQSVDNAAAASELNNSSSSQVVEDDSALNELNMSKAADATAAAENQLDKPDERDDGGGDGGGGSKES